VVQCNSAGGAIQTVRENESYSLSVTPRGARVHAVTPAGALRGLATFAQLVELGPEGYRLPAVEIEDTPRFPWRGLMLDVSRHWMPIAVVKRTLDAMAAVKLNVFHWHLSDDQGFRVESSSRPKLHEMGSDGHYYTHDEVREIIAYARDRGIRVVPEFDMPGHATSWLVGYPELGSAPGPFQIERKWGIFNPCLDPGNEEVYRFLDGLIGEMAALFPDEYFHVGGDEVNGEQWKANARIQEFMRSHGMKQEHELQAYFSKRVQEIVARHGKKMMGWDEILQPGLPRDVAVQSWRGQKSLAEAARQGYSGILSSGYYLDLMYHSSEHYAVDPLGKEAASLTPEEQKLILGGEACEWAEFATPENIDARLWPRGAVVAERLWSPQSVRDVADMYRRLEAVSRKLDFAGADHLASYRRMTQRLAGVRDVEPVRVLAGVVEPVKKYSRNRIQKGSYTSFTPLNRMVDVARPESIEAIQVSRMVERLPLTAGEIRRRLLIWRDNDARLQPVIQQSALLAEVAPLSRDLASIATTGLEALDRIQAGQHDPGWASRQEKSLDAASQQHAELLLSVVDPVRRLVRLAK